MPKFIIPVCCDAVDLTGHLVVTSKDEEEAEKLALQYVASRLESSKVKFVKEKI